MPPTRSEATARIDRFRRWLHDHNQPFTRQREAVATTVLGSGTHLSVEEIRDVLAGQGVAFGLATI
jgi:Fe2+ or Zn2+ uptake regulation protein